MRAKASYPPHNVPLVLLGAGILWFGWFGFNAGSALGANQLASSAFTATQLAAAAATISWAVVERAFTGKVTVVGMATACVVGLATITPASGFVGPMPAILIGAAAGVVVFMAERFVLTFKRVDDAFGVVACHGVGGGLGILLLGLFAQYTINPAGLTSTNGARINGLAFGDPGFLGHQVIADLAIIAYVMVVTWLLGLLVRSTIGLRVKESEEVSASGLGDAFDLAAYEPWDSVVEGG
jgi:Amt family ammonium transporter